MKTKRTNLKTLLLFAALLLGLSIHAQIKEAGDNLTPGGIFDKVYDKDGNEYKLMDLAISKDNKAGKSMSALSQTLCASSGNFILYFETGSGFELNTPTHIARRNVLCQLFGDLSAFIIWPNPNTKVNIWIRDINNLVPGASTSGVLGLATSFYTMPSGAPGVTGIVDNEIWKTIHTGVDSYAGVVSPLFTQGGTNLGFYHGMAAFNFTNPAFTNIWHTDLATTTAAGFLDMYSIGLHEAVHALGFASLIDGNGSSKLSVAGYNYYARYDMFLQTMYGQNLITNTGLCSLYNFAFSPWLNPLTTLAPNSSVCTPNNTSCGSALRFGGAVNQAVYTPNCFEPASSLSHLEDQCRTIPQPNDEYYNMSNANGGGPQFMKRYLKPEERQVLCDIGYNLNSTYGNNLNPNNFFNYFSGACPGLLIGGVNDGINPGGSYTWATVQGGAVVFSGSQILGNDFNAVGFECLEDVYGGGFLNVTSGNSGSTIIYSPTMVGTQLLRYVPIDASGNRGNITYIFVRVNSGNCVPSNCNMITNGGLESGSPCGGQYTQQYVFVDCWDVLMATPDYYVRGCLPTGGVPYLTVPTGTQACNPPSDTWSGVAGNNDRFIGLWSIGIYNGGEAMQTQLSSPIMPNVPYTLTFRAKVSPNFNIFTPNNIATVSFRGDPGLNFVPAPNLGPFTMGLAALASTTVNNDATWHQFTLTFIYTGSQALNSLLIANTAAIDSYVFIDDVQLSPSSTTATFTPPTPLCLGNTITDLSQFANPPGGTFSGPNVINTGGIYSFTAATAGTFLVNYTYSTTIGCMVSIPQQIVVSSVNPPTVTAIASPSATCANSTVTLTAGGASSYTWSPTVTCISPCSVATVIASGNTTYTVTGTNTIGCSSTATVSVMANLPSICCVPANTVIPNNSVSSSYPSSLSNMVIDVLGNFTVNSNVFYSNIIFRMAPNAKIVVNSINSLTLSSCSMLTCSDMWDGIYLMQSGTDAASLTVSTCTLEDAINGIVANSNNTVYGPNIRISASSLNKNLASLQITNYTGLAYPLTLRQSTLNCISSTNSPGAGLKAPYLNQRSEVGILLRKVDAIQIGQTGNAVAMNTFNNLNYGIYGLKSSAKIYNNTFSMAGFIPVCPPLPTPCPPPTGIAIYMPNTAANTNNLVVGGVNANEPNIFSNVLRAIEGNYISSVDVIKNVFSCTSTPASFLFGSSSLTSQYGILLTDIFKGVTINSNTFTNFANAIAYTRNSTTTTPFNPGVDISNNSIGVSGSGYVTTGIYANDVPSNTTTGSTTLKIMDNQLTNIRGNGIKVHYIKNRPVIAGTGNLTQSVHMLYNTSTKYGIYTQNCDRAVIANNMIYSNSSANAGLHGIYMRQSTNSRIQCNSISNVGTCLSFYDNCTGPYTLANNYTYGVLSNIFASAWCGINFVTNGSVGQQGDASHPTGNIWSGPATLFAGGQTRTDATSNPALSPFYCNIAPGSQWPVFHQTSGGTAFVNGSTILNLPGMAIPLCPDGLTLGQRPAKEESAEIITGLSSEIIAQPMLQVYPNPNNGLFHIETDSELSDVTVKIIDILGKTVFLKHYRKFQGEEINLDTVNNGLYGIEISGPMYNQYFKIVKQ